MNNITVNNSSTTKVFGKEKEAGSRVLEIKPVKTKEEQQLSYQTTGHEIRIETRESKNDESQSPDLYAACAVPRSMPPFKSNLKRNLPTKESCSTSCMCNANSSTSTKY